MNSLPLLLIAFSSLFVGCVSYRREPPRLNYSLDRLGSFLVSTSPSFDKKLIEKQDGTVRVRSGWLIKNASETPQTITTGTADLTLRENRKIAAKCFTNNKALFEATLAPQEQIVVHCEAKLPFSPRGTSSDEKAQFNLYLKSDLKLSNSIFLKAEDFE